MHKDVLPVLFTSEASGLLRFAGTCALGRVSAVAQESQGSAMTRKTLQGVHVCTEKENVNTLKDSVSQIIK